MVMVERTMSVIVSFGCCVDGRNSFRPTPSVITTVERLQKDEISLSEWTHIEFEEFKIEQTHEIIEKCKNFASSHRLCDEGVRFSEPIITERVIYSKWTLEEEEFVIENYGKITSVKIADKLGRSKSSVYSKIWRMRKKGLI